MEKALSFYWGLLLAALMLAAIMRREQITNTWAWWVTVPRLAYAGVAVLLVVAMLVFVVNGPVGLGR